MIAYIVVAVFGLIIGSFLNVCIYRIPNKESIAYPGSKCGTCKTSLKPLDLLPVFSYVFLRGKCRCCKSKVSIQYPLVEFSNGLLYVLLYHFFALSITSIAYSILFSILLTVAIIDYKTMRIPNSIVIFGLIIGSIYLLTSAFYYKDISIILRGLTGMLVGGAIIGGFMLLALVLFRKQGMGMGDLKLLAMIGLFVASTHVLYTIFIAVVLAGISGVIILIKGGRGVFPFGPFISAGAVVSILWGSALWSTYLSLI